MVARAVGAVNGVATGALLASVVFAVGDWWSKLRDDRRLEYVCKPATLLALVLVAVSLDPVAGQDDRRAWFVAALVLCLAGDIFLMVPRDLFVPGLAAFLVGHVCYIAGFWSDPPAAFAFVVAAAIVIIGVAPIASRVLAALRARPDLRPAVAVYMVVISVMVASALASGIVVAAAGAILFAVSDSLIAWDRFVAPLAWAGVVIMMTYHVGQALLTLSLLTS
jgi:uncharacterized membrane protein YhhN